MNDFLESARGVAALTDIATNRKLRQVGKKEMIFHEDDELRSIYFINTGKVRGFKMNNDGKELVTGLYGPGEFLGYMSVLEGGRVAEAAEAIEATELAIIPREELQALLYRDRDVSMRFIKMLTREVKEKEERLLDLAYASVRQRVAQALLHLHKRFGEDTATTLGVQISREDLATIVGTATESLIRALTDLKEDNLIEVRGREIHLRNVKGLERLAND